MDLSGIRFLTSDIMRPLRADDRYGTMKTFPFRSLSLLATLAAASCCYAGHWAVSYSGGVQIAGTQSHPYSPGSGGYGGGGMSASGQVTATLTWTLDYPTDASTPPDYLFVMLNCTAAGSAMYNMVAPSADDGFGDAPTTVVTNMGRGYTARKSPAPGPKSRRSRRRAESPR